jgi:hypothetical protein
MQSNHQPLFAASQLKGGVANCLLEYLTSDIPIEFFDFMEIVGTLDLAIEVIGLSNGASNDLISFDI